MNRVCLLLASLVFFIGLTKSAESAIQTRTFDSEPIKILKVKQLSGTLTIRGSQTKAATVISEALDVSDACKLEMQQVNETLSIRVEKPLSETVSTCTYDIDITLPKSVALDIDSAAADVAVADTEGDIRFSLGTGNFSATAEIKKLFGRTGTGRVVATGHIDSAKVESGAGRLSLSGLTGDAQIKTGTGDVELTYKKGELAKALIDIKSGQGHTTIRLPENAKVASSFHLGQGQVENEFIETAGGPVNIRVMSGQGNLSIKKLQ